MDWMWDNYAIVNSNILLKLLYYYEILDLKPFKGNCETDTQLCACTQLCK